jgi:hypothetical protein
MSDAVVQSHWDEHVAWSRAATRLKNRRSRARLAALLLTIFGAILQTVSATVPVVQLAAGIAGTVALTLVPFIGLHFLKPEETKKWLRARSISEGIKSEIYTYRAAAAPYDGAGAIQLLSDKVREIRDFGEDIILVRGRVEEGAEAAPGPLDANDYLKKRAKDQIQGYYEHKGDENVAMANLFRTVEIALAGAAAVLSGVATYAGGTLGPWVAVITTVGGSVAAYAAASRYEFQATTFFATARQLKDLVEDWELKRKSWSEFVRGCEEAISAENRGWMAKLDDKAQGGGGT